MARPKAPRVEPGEYAYDQDRRRLGRVVTAGYNEKVTLRSLLRDGGTWLAHNDQVTAWDLKSLGAEESHPVKHTVSCVACPEGSPGYQTQIEASEWALQHAAETQHPMFRFTRASYSVVRPRAAAT